MATIPGHVFPRALGGPLPKAVKAEHVWIHTADGRRFLDASGGAVVVNLGHSRPEVARAVAEQLTTMHYAHPTMFTNQPVEDLADRLATKTPEGIDRFYFLSGGGEAVETAIKLARQIHLERDQATRFRLVSRWLSYHGATLGALAATGRTGARTSYLPMMADAVHIPPPYCLRCHYGLSYPACDLRCAGALEDVLLELGPRSVSAFLAETVSGATLAVYPPPPDYWTRIRQICGHYGVLLIADEVMCGMGRTGHWFACEHYDLVPDLMTMGKGLAGGTVACSAVGVQERHFQAIVDGGGAFPHAGTYSHHAVAAAAANAVFDLLESEGLVDRVRRLGPVLGQKLRDAVGDHPNVVDVRGLGFFWGVEFVADQKTKAPFPAGDKITQKVWQALFDRGIITYRASGLAGGAGDALMVAPPFVITEDEMDLVALALAQAVAQVLGD